MELRTERKPLRGKRAAEWPAGVPLDGILRFVPRRMVDIYVAAGWSVVESCPMPRGWAVLMERKSWKH